MKKGGKADTAQDKAMIKKAFKQHDMQEHKGGKGTKLALKKGGKMATGGVVNGQGGYATGGVAKSNGGGYKKGGATKKAYAAGGTVNSGRPVAMPQGNKKPSQPVSINQLSGTFKKGGKVRKMAEGGDLMSLGDRDRLLQEAMQAANNPPEVALDFSQDPSFQAGPQDSANDYDSQLRLNTDQRRENQNQYYNQGNVDSYSRPQSIEFPFDASQQRLAPPPSSGLTAFEKDEFERKARPPMPGRVDETGRGYGSYRPEPKVTPYKAGGRVARSKRMADGGSSSDKGEDMSKGAYDKAPKYSRDVEDALNPLGMVKELASKAKNFFMPKKTADSVTKTKESVTVTPAKKRGGAVNC
jgi:hypothetical protein